MAKRNAEKPDLSRSGKHTKGRPGRAPLLIVAGLPDATAKIAAATINNDVETRWYAVAGTFPNNDGEIYARADTITDLMTQACKFAIADAKDKDGIPIPSRIALAYVAAAGSDNLWDGFGHSVWPIPLVHPDRDPNKRHWRFDIHAVNALLALASRSAEAEFAEAMRLRLEARRSDDVLLLPGRNFHLANDQRLATRFRSFMRGELTAPQIEREVRVERFAYERLAEFYNRTGGRGKRFAVDQRELVFAKSHLGQDGGLHDIVAGERLSQALLRRALEGRYRFGTPLQPPGFQHDVQREGGVDLVRERFDCSGKGLIEVSADHANVFANDVVTARLTRKI